MQGLISGLSVLFCWPVCLCLLQSLFCLLELYNLICFEIRKLRPPALFFFLKIILTIQGPLSSHINFGMDFSILAKEDIVGILIRIALNL